MAPWGPVQLVVLVFLPCVYILLACCALGQWSLLFSALSNAAYAAKRQPGMDAVAPLLSSFVRYLEAIFGASHKFTPNATHVLLVAILIAFIHQQQRA